MSFDFADPEAWECMFPASDSDAVVPRALSTASAHCHFTALAQTATRDLPTAVKKTRPGASRIVLAARLDPDGPPILQGGVTYGAEGTVDRPVEVPGSWASPLTLTPRQYEGRYPGNRRTIAYRDATVVRPPPTHSFSPLGGWRSVLACCGVCVHVYLRPYLGGGATFRRNTHQNLFSTGSQTC